MSPRWPGFLVGFGRDLVRGVLQLLYPGICAACHQPLPAEATVFCPTCRKTLTTDSHAACPRCAATIGPFVLMDNGCSQCRDCPFQFESAMRVGPYEGLLREVILRIKHAGGEELAELIGELWAEHAGPRLRDVGATVVIPVPLHWRRRLNRGYNQSETLARSLASRLRVPCRPRWLRRVRATLQQTRQTPAGRRENVRGAFRARAAALRGQTVLLVDDVLTTGSTCSEAARALRLAGASRVVVAVLAHSQA